MGSAARRSALAALSASQAQMAGAGCANGYPLCDPAAPLSKADRHSASSWPLVRPGPSRARSQIRGSISPLSATRRWARRPTPSGRGRRSGGARKAGEATPLSSGAVCHAARRQVRCSVSNRKVPRSAPVASVISGPGRSLCPCRGGAMRAIDRRDNRGRLQRRWSMSLEQRSPPAKLLAESRMREFGMAKCGNLIAPKGDDSLMAIGAGGFGPTGHRLCC